MEGDAEAPSDETSVFLPKMHKKTVNILSLDGGGVKGIIETRTLDLILKTTSKILTRPHELRNFYDDDDDEFSLKLYQDDRQKFLKILDEVDNPIQPAILFDMIVGTSTGGLIAFALGGVMKEALPDAPADAGAVVPMSVDQVIEMYKNISAHIFSKKAYGFFDFDEKALALIAPSMMKFYSQDPLKEVLLSYYGDLRLRDVDTECVVGCVAKQMPDEAGTPDASVLFSNLSVEHMEVPVVDVLLATSDAPIYFECPRVIEGKCYVDGGIGANCPLAQALQATQEIMGRDINIVVLSLAPPATKPKPIDPDGTKQVLQWLQYFPDNLTHGATIFENCKNFKEGHPGVHHIRRISPETEALRKHKMDDAEDVELMLSETDDYVVGGREGDGDDGVLLILSHAITQLVPFFSNVKKRRAMTKFLKPENIQGNNDIYKALMPLAFAVSQRLHVLEPNSKSSVETLEAALQILELFEAQRDVEYFGERNYLLESKMYRSLGTMYRNVGRLCEARICHRRALADIRLHGAERKRHELVQCLVELGETCMYLGRKGEDDNEKYLRDAKAIIDEEESLFFRKRILLKLAECCRLKGKFTASLKLLEEAEEDESLEESELLLVTKNKAGLKRQVSAIQLASIPDPSATISSQNEVRGLIQFLEDDFAGSQRSFQDALRTRKDAPHYEIARMYNLIGTACLKTGDVLKANAVFRQSISRMDRADGRLDGLVGFSSPITAAARNGVGICALKQCESHTALKHFEKSLEILKSVHGEEASHPDIHDVLNNIAICQYNMKMYEKTEDLLEKAVDSWGEDEADSVYNYRRSTVIGNRDKFKKAWEKSKSLGEEDVSGFHLEPIAFYH